MLSLKDRKVAIGGEALAALNDRLNKAAFKLAQLVHTGELTEGTIHRELERRRRHAGCCKRTVRGGSRNNRERHSGGPIEAARCSQAGPERRTKRRSNPQCDRLRMTFSTW